MTIFTATATHIVNVWLNSNWIHEYNNPIDDSDDDDNEDADEDFNDDHNDNNDDGDLWQLEHLRFSTF